MLSKRIREKIEGDLDEAEDKKLLLENLLALVSGKPPLLEEETTVNSQKAKVKDELNGQSTRRERFMEQRQR